MKCPDFCGEVDDFHLNQRIRRENPRNRSAGRSRHALGGPFPLPPKWTLTPTTVHREVAEEVEITQRNDEFRFNK